MIHPRTESSLDRAELLRAYILALDARRPGTVERLNDNRQMDFAGTEQADYVLLGHRCLFLTTYLQPNGPVGAERQVESRVELLETRLESRSSEQGPQTLQQDSRATPPTVIGVNAGRTTTGTPTAVPTLLHESNRKELGASRDNAKEGNSISPLLETGVVDGGAVAWAKGQARLDNQPEFAGSNPAATCAPPSATNTGDRGFPGILFHKESDQLRSLATDLPDTSGEVAEGRGRVNGIHDN